ncbi:MAG TPA: type II secretion system protein [Deferrisomatales bacterium]|nr:type II secretion system protein [Deferrisomatales bacterium]
MNRHRETRRDRGFTLVEALVALGLFAVGMAALMPLAVTNVRANANASVRTHALALAQEEIERFRATPFSDLPAVGATGTPAVLDAVYTRQWSVVAVPTPLTGDADDLRRIRVVVGWNLPNSTGDVTLITAKTRY